MAQQIDDPIVGRTLDVDGEPRFHLRLYKPLPEDGGAYWRCRYEVDGPLTRRVAAVCGHDAMQALLFALYTLGSEAEGSQENLTGRLSWDGQTRHFGFPPLSADPDVAEMERLRQAKPA